MTDYFCLDCNKLIDQPIPGVISGALRTDGDMSIQQEVPGGTIFGKALGYVCNECSVFGVKDERLRSKNLLGRTR